MIASVFLGFFSQCLFTFPMELLCPSSEKMEPKGGQEGHLKARKIQFGDLRFLTHPTVNLRDFRGPGGVWRDTFSNCFSEFFVINASNALFEIL